MRTALPWFLCLALAISALYMAAGLPAAGEVDPRVAPLVRALEDHYRNMKTLQAIFLERYSESRDSIQLESGTVYFSRPGRMRWEYESPERKLFLVDGKTVWFYVPSDHTASRAPVKESEDWRTPLALLTGKVKLRELCDRIQPAAAMPNGLTNADANRHAFLSCVPRGEQHASQKSSSIDPESGLAAPSLPFDRVLLEVDPATGQLEDVRVMQPGGIELEYRFGNWHENLPIPEALFHFQAPAGVAIVDQPTAPSP